MLFFLLIKVEMLSLGFSSFLCLYCRHFSGSDKPRMLFFLLIKVEMLSLGFSSFLCPYCIYKTQVLKSIFVFLLLFVISPFILLYVQGKLSSRHITSLLKVHVHISHFNRL